MVETTEIETLGIMSASSALAARHGKGKREKHAAIIHVSVCDQVCVSVCVCLHGCMLLIQRYH